MPHLNQTLLAIVLVVIGLLAGLAAYAGGDGSLIPGLFFFFLNTLVCGYALQFAQWKAWLLYGVISLGTFVFLGAISPISLVVRYAAVLLIG